MLENDSYSGYQLKSVLDEAVKQFPKNSTLWIKSLRCHLDPKEDEPLPTKCPQLLQQLQLNSLPCSGSLSKLLDLHPTRSLFGRRQSNISKP